MYGAFEVIRRSGYAVQFNQKLLPVAVVRQTRPQAAAGVHLATEPEGWVRLAHRDPCREY